MVVVTTAAGQHHAPRERFVAPAPVHRDAGCRDEGGPPICPGLPWALSSCRCGEGVPEYRDAGRVLGRADWQMPTTSATWVGLDTCSCGGGGTQGQRCIVRARHSPDGKPPRCRLLRESHSPLSATCALQRGSARNTFHNTPNPAGLLLLAVCLRWLRQAPSAPSPCSTPAAHWVRAHTRNDGYEPSLPASVPSLLVCAEERVALDRTDQEGSACTWPWLLASCPSLLIPSRTPQTSPPW